MPYDPQTVFTGTPADMLRQKMISAISPGQPAAAASPSPAQPVGNDASDMDLLKQKASAARKARLRQLAEGTYE